MTEPRTPQEMTPVRAETAALRRRRYHEAGHAVIAHAFGRRLDVVTVVASPDHWSGLTASRYPDTAAAFAAFMAERAEIAARDLAAPPPPLPLVGPATRASIEIDICVTLAGIAAEQAAGVYPGGYHMDPDEEEAERLAHVLATASPRHAELVAAHADTNPDEAAAWALSDDLAGPEAMQHHALMLTVTRRMVAERGAQIHALAEALIAHPILDGPEAEAIIEGAARSIGSEEASA